MESLEDKIKKYFTSKEMHDNPATRHPMIAGIAAGFAAEYARSRVPYLRDLGFNEAFSMLVGYGTYLSFGSVKEYILEQRKKVLRIGTGVYDWLLNNPKIAGLLGTLAGGFVAQRSQDSVMRYIHSIGESQKLPIELADQMANTTFGRAIFAGLLAEASVRALRNIRRIKKSVKKIKTNVAEKTLNFVFEHPILLSSAASVSFFAFMYNRLHELHQKKLLHIEYARDRFDIFTGNPFEDTINNPERMMDMFLIDCGYVGLGAFILLSAGGYFLHTHSIREHALRAQRLYNTARGRKKEAREYQRRLANLPNSREKTIEDIVELGNMYYDEGNEEEAFKSYRMAMSLLTKKSDDAAYADFLRKTPGVSRMIRWYKRRRNAKTKQQKDINEIFIDLLNKDRRALVRVRKELETEKDPSQIYIYAKALEFFGENKEAAAQKQRAVRMRLEDNPKTFLIAGSKNPVFRFHDQMLNTEVIAKSGTLEKLERERKTTEIVKILLRDFENFDVPEPIGIISHNGKDCYIMEYASGELLSDRITNQEYSSNEIYASAEFMAYLHAKLGKEGLEERDYAGSITERLSLAGVPQETLLSIKNNIHAATRSLEFIIRACNLDSHPRNRIVDEFGGIVAVDLETDRLIPVTADAANLLDQYRISDDEKEKALDGYISAFQHYSGEHIERGMYRLAYLNSVIVRALEIYSQVRSLNPAVKEASLMNAQEAISKIRKSHQLYYLAHEKEYKGLAEAIKVLQEF